MKKIDFTHFTMFDDISQKSTHEENIRENIADLMYKNTSGIHAHDLALRIYRTEGPISMTDKDLSVMDEFLQNATPIFIDSYKANLIEEKP